MLRGRKRKFQESYVPQPYSSDGDSSFDDGEPVRHGLQEVRVQVLQEPPVAMGAESDITWDDHDLEDHLPVPVPVPEPHEEAPLNGYLSDDPIIHDDDTNSDHQQQQQEQQHLHLQSDDTNSDYVFDDDEVYETYEEITEDQEDNEDSENLHESTEEDEDHDYFEQAEYDEDEDEQDQLFHENRNAQNAPVAQDIHVHRVEEEESNEEEDDNEEDEELEDLDYSEILHEMSKKWMNTELDHTVSKLASNAF